MVFGLLSSGSSAGIAAAQDQPPVSDNSKANERDRSQAAPNRAQNTASDREITQKIRKALMDDQSLSTDAHNLKIISQRGKVTLKGPVRSEEEKTKVIEMATEVVGAANVTNQITIKPEKPARRS